MKKSPITIKDIARALNLSHSTVARALNDSYKISSQTTQMVKEYAVLHNYHPNIIAQSLRNRKSRSIGVMLCSIPNNFFAEVINGIESVASDRDYHVMISQSHESSIKELKDLKHFECKAVDGLLVSLSSETEDIAPFEELINKGVPIVFFDRVPEKITTHKVIVNDKEGTCQLVNHLISQGFKKIAHITSSCQLSITKRRLDGYRTALLQNGLAVNEDYIKYCRHGGRDETEVEDVLDQLLKMKCPPDAITTASDRITIKTFALLNDKGIVVPQHIALGGFSNFSAPQLFHPPLTTIVQPAFGMGKTAMEILLRLVENKKPTEKFQTIVLPVELQIRQSSQKNSGLAPRC